ncbi:hypothetical protein H112_03838 [Trichophyton rubrum D6]|uniref:Uncharacterized protein n=1 Tax=Trichophyton rubrum CBS 288.86 TaxID=1215330 RepID=A0A022W482_TRIRU|nr:hypothetical protein H100_03846 [Trichophyton rubrum MR850]EZF42545.1 hypothetical protein H102_03833 [Trichophyton rubrum CBS 100081]EZF53162.1 hypothetical protein H103_03848 [Trichophyton rubrum CBS 288.86]EZF63830.1 hypothetical protein H104_03832 [Trichophyton rubrum CBS 289.86]EZF85109.1 hypothetical protein H110_03839 [Trichophyton rubrum MR1448]EZG17383.1 hypothetical protein H107_03957 [Trichophyton rubrum CBS 202.88]KDB34323.1 hypothetical protein H112_03838 [Trichophyton rubrum 
MQSYSAGKSGQTATHISSPYQAQSLGCFQGWPGPIVFLVGLRSNSALEGGLHNSVCRPLLARYGVPNLATWPALPCHQHLALLTLAYPWIARRNQKLAIKVSLRGRKTRQMDVSRVLYCSNPSARSGRGGRKGRRLEGLTEIQSVLRRQGKKERRARADECIETAAGFSACRA